MATKPGVGHEIRPPVVKQPTRTGQGHTPLNITNARQLGEPPGVGHTPRRKNPPAK